MWSGLALLTRAEFNCAPDRSAARGQPEPKQGTISASGVDFSRRAGQPGSGRHRTKQPSLPTGADFPSSAPPKQ